MTGTRTETVGGSKSDVSARLCCNQSINQTQMGGSDELAQATLAAAVIVLFVEAHASLLLLFPQRRRVENLFDEFDEGILHAQFGLCRGLEEEHIILLRELRALVARHLPRFVEVDLVSDEHFD